MKTTISFTSPSMDAISAVIVDAESFAAIVTTTDGASNNELSSTVANKIDLTDCCDNDK